VCSSDLVDLFCGAGGLSHGFKNQNFVISAGIDIDEVCRYPYEANNEAPFVCKDVTSLSSEDVACLFRPNSIRILVGCAPCQPFSTYNQKNENPNWRLLSAFGDLISKTLPDIVSMENVPRLLNFQGGSVFQSFVDTLETAGYNVKWGVLYGPDFGLAQTRSRLVLLASRLGEMELPIPTHKNDHRTVQDEIGNLKSLKAGEVDKNDPLHRSSKLSELNFRRMKAALPGGTWRDWPKNLVAVCHQKSSGEGYASVYGRMQWSKPSPTITTQFYGFGNGRFGHPDQDRALSLREGALLQGFPENYKFVAPGEKVQISNIGRLIGNAVPVKLAEAIAKAVHRHLELFA